MAHAKHTKRIDRLDPRVMAAFGGITVLLLAPALVNALTPADEAALHDAASSLAMRGRQAMAIVDARPRLTSLLYEAELEDIAAAAADTRGHLEREAIVTGAEVHRTTIVDAAGDLADAVDAASLAGDDDAARARARARIAAAVGKLATTESGA